MPEPPVFLLDQNFPDTVISRMPLPDLVLRPLRDVHPDLVSDHEDWEVLRDLRLRGGVDGLITLDNGMLNLGREMIVLHQSRLSLVVLEGVRNDPIVALGLLLVHAPSIARQTDNSRAQLWVLRKPQTGSSVNPWTRIDVIAARGGESARDLYRRNRLPPNLFLRRSSP